LKKYFADHVFSSITTEKFIEYLEVNLLKNNKINFSVLQLKDWIYSPGLPAGFRVPESSRFKKVESLAEATLKGQLPGFPEVKDWSSHEWLHYLRKLEGKSDVKLMEQLDKRFSFGKSRNSEILFQWLYNSLKVGYSPALESTENFLIHTGRRKFVLPLYRELCKTVPGKDLAVRIFSSAAAGYHPVTRQSVEKELGIVKSN
jgi:hypothetical protein